MKDLSTPVDRAILDRLVDGQLSDVEYRRLLTQLESCPDGWRQCALSFLEHQALAADLEGILGESASGRPPTRSSVYHRQATIRWK